MAGVIVTGAGGGIGETIARHLAASGHRVGVLDHDPDRVAVVAESLPDAVALVASITDEAAMLAALDTFGAPDGLVNNAGIVRFGPLLTHSSEDFRAVLDTNLFGAFLMSRSVAKLWVDAGRPGSIVSVTSINGTIPAPNSGAYGPAKAGIALLTQLMAVEWGPYGIRANAVAPGLIDGGMSAPIHADLQVRRQREERIPLRRLGTNEDIARVVAWLLSEDAGYVTGQNLLADGGLAGAVLTMLPRPASVDGIGAGR